MIIVSKVYDRDKIISLKGDVEGMVEYVKSTIPEPFRHHEGLISNQRFFLSTKILSDEKIPIKVKTEVSNTLVDGVKVVGYLDRFTDIGEVQKFVKTEKLNVIWEKEKKDNGY